MNPKSGLPAVASERGGGSNASIKPAFQLVNENIVAGELSSTNTTKENLSLHLPWINYKTPVISFGQMKRCEITELYFSMDNGGYNGRNNTDHRNVHEFSLQLEQFKSAQFGKVMIEYF